MSEAKPTIKARAVSGMAEYGEAANAELSGWMDGIAEVYRLHGYAQLFPRPLELREVLLSKGGVQKQIFGVSRLDPAGETELALPFDHTVPLANWLGRFAGDVVFPYRRFDMGYSYRGERAQHGRFRAFIQADVDIVGSGELGLWADAEVIAVIYQALRRIGCGRLRIAVNHLNWCKAFLREGGVSEADMAAVLTLLDRTIGEDSDTLVQQLVAAQLLPQAAAEKLAAAMRFTGEPQAFASQFGTGGEAAAAGWAELLEVWDWLARMGVPADAVEFRPAIVRGLDYYTGTVFETFLADLPGAGSIASGGRYDDLTATFLTRRLPGVGGSIGVSRLFAFAEKAGLLNNDRRTRTDCLLFARTAEGHADCLALAQRLRAHGIACELSLGADSISNQLRYANRKGFRRAISWMDPSVFLTKDLAASTQEELTSADAVLAWLNA